MPHRRHRLYSGDAPQGASPFFVVSDCVLPGFAKTVWIGFAAEITDDSCGDPSVRSVQPAAAQRMLRQELADSSGGASTTSGIDKYSKLLTDRFSGSDSDVIGWGAVTAESNFYPNGDAGASRRCTSLRRGCIRS